MEKCILICVFVTLMSVCSSAFDSPVQVQNISCADPPFVDDNDMSIHGKLYLLVGLMHFIFKTYPEFVMVGECRNLADCDPYGFSMCSDHKKWAKKCCALYCNFCHQ
ncbi:hypothetical protein EGW08_019244 [Elysia chlorotica]|uniref:ShKT domain-containing protein n=1 Tax=Elysia chlorotica TaxID=188477 RepID=A0A3S1B651_ELYCH|nr:hypothetical protein EGW08_019244 [Elysia chlorotica]